MFRKIIEKREQRKKDKFYKKGFKEGSNDILIFLTDGPITPFNNTIEVMDRMTEYMISYKDADKLLKSLNEKDIVFIVGCSNLIVHFPYECEQYTNGTKVVLVNPNENGESFINNESLIKKKACDAVPDIEDMIMKHLK